MHTDNKPLWDRKAIENTPFWLIGNTDQGYNITMGKYKLTQNAILGDNIDQAMQEANAWLEQNKWDVILTICLCAITDVTYKDEKKK
jgi:hypothetical protein